MTTYEKVFPQQIAAFRAGNNFFRALAFVQAYDAAIDALLTHDYKTDDVARHSTPRTFVQKFNDMADAEQRFGFALWQAMTYGPRG